MEWIKIADALGITEESCVEQRVCRETYEEYISRNGNLHGYHRRIDFNRRWRGRSQYHVCLCEKKNKGDRDQDGSWC